MRPNRRDLAVHAVAVNQLVLFAGQSQQAAARPPPVLWPGGQLSLRPPATSRRTTRPTRKTAPSSPPAPSVSSPAPRALSPQSNQRVEARCLRQGGKGATFLTRPRLRRP